MSIEPTTAQAIAAAMMATGAAGVAVVDRELRYVHVNDALARMNGLPVGAHAGRPIRDVIPAVAADVLEPLLRQVIATGEPAVDLPAVVEVPSGERRRFVSSYQPVRDGSGAITGALALVLEQQGGDEQARLTAERLRRVAESGIVGLFFWTIDGGITEANDAFLQLLGWTREDLAAGRVDWRTMTPPEYAAGDEAAIAEMLATGRHAPLPKAYVGKDGRPVPVVVTSAFLAGSRDTGVCVCIDDRARRAAESRFARVLAQTPAAVCVMLGPDHVVHSVNAMYVRMFGRREYVGRPARDLFPEVDTAGFLALLDDVYRTGATREGREVPVTWNGDDGTPHEGFLDFIYQPLVDDRGAVDGVLVFVMEVTPQVRARRDTERAAARIARLQAITASLAGVRTMTEVADVVVTQAVEATGARSSIMAVRVPGDADATVLGQRGLPPALMAGRSRITADAFGPAADVLRTGEAVWATSRAELDRRWPQVRAVWEQLGTVAIAALPLTVAGETVGMMSYTFDAPRALDDDERAFFVAVAQQAAVAVERARLFEAERLARREAEQARAEAEAASQAKSLFLATMSHELRTPLNAIGGYAELIEMGLRGPVTSQQREDLSRIQRSQQHLLGLINEVLNYARLESGSVRYDIADVGVAGVLASVESLVLPQARARGVALSMAPCPPTLAVRADPEKLRQVLLNLLSNAIKFTEAGGSITVTAATPTEATVALAVADTGVGIAPDQREAIFEPFVQVGRALNRPGEGTGLGLAISRDLARGMGGDLTVESALDAGSTFTLVLPRAA